MTITIPQSVDSGQGDPAARSRARVAYMLRMASLAVGGKGSIRSLAKHCEIDPSTLSHAIKRGRISDSIAVRIESSVGRHVISHEMLRDPMGVPIQ